MRERGRSGAFLGGTCATRWPSGIRNSLPPCHNPSGSASRLLRQNNPVRDRAVRVITTAVEAAKAAPVKSP